MEEGVEEEPRAIEERKDVGERVRVGEIMMVD